MSSLIIFMLLSLFVNSGNILKHEIVKEVEDIFKGEISKKLSKLFSLLCVNVFKEANLVSISYSRNTEFVVPFLKQISNNILIPQFVRSVTSSKHEHSYKKRSLIGENDILLYLLESVSSLEVFLAKYDELYWNNRAYVLVICLVSNTSLLEEDFHTLLPEHFLKNVVKNALVFVPIHDQSKDSFNNSSSHNICVTSHYPFLSKMEKASFILEESVKATYVFKRFYSTSKLENLHGFTIRAATFYNTYLPILSFIKKEETFVTEGYVAKVFNVLGNHINFTIDFSRVYGGWHELGRILPNGTFTDLIGDLQRKEADVAFADTVLFYIVWQYLDYSESFDITPAAIIIPKGNVMSPWKSILVIYKSHMWLSICGIFVIVITVTKCMQYVTGTVEAGDNLSAIFMRIFSILLQISVTEPQKDSVRILHFSWIYFTLIVVSAFLGGIISCLTVPQHYPDINTLQELAESKISPTGIAYFGLLLRDTSNPVLSALGSRYEVDSDYENVFRKKLMQGKPIGLIGSEPLLRHLARNMNPCFTCTERFHIMKENLGNMPRALLFAAGFPLVPSVNTLLRRMKDSGLMSKWISDEVNRIESSSVCEMMCNKPIVLSLQHLETFFFLLLVGLSLGVVAFLVELIYEKVNGKDKVKLFT